MIRTQCSSDTKTAPFLWLKHAESSLFWFVICILSFQILLVATFSFQFRYKDDSSFIYYLTWLINERGYLPYLDLHETSFPGTFLIYALITKATGYSSLAFNAVHLSLLSLLSVTSYGFLRRIHTRMAAVTTLMFASSYLMMDNSVYMQRDFITLLFMLLACYTMTSQWQLAIRSSITGILFCMAASIKPQTALIAPAVVLCGTHIANHYHQKNTLTQPFSQGYIAAILWSLGGFLLTVVIFSAWLISNGTWQAFIHMLTNYMPLYEMLNGVGESLTPQQRWKNGFDWLQGQLLSGAIPSLVGISIIFYQKTLSSFQKKICYFLIVSWILCVVSVAIAGKFYDYHQIPSNFFFISILSLCFIPITTTSWLTTSWRVICLILVGFFVQNNINPVYALAMTCHDSGNPVCMVPERQDYDIEDRLAHFLRDNLKPGERVEPLTTSVVGPIFFSMLKAKAEPVTPYLEGFQYYHRTDQAVIQNIHKDALHKLKQSPPRFMLSRQEIPPIARDFNDLWKFITQNYNELDKHQYPVLHDPMPVTIYELKAPQQ